MPVPNMILDRFAVVPDVLNKPVKNVQEKCEEIGLILFGEEVALTVLLAELLHIPHDQYRLLLVEWLQLYEAMLPQVWQWTSAQGLSMVDYIKHLWADSTADGLEVWLSSLASGTTVNIVQEDHVWGSSCEGIDFSKLTYVLIGFGQAVSCLLEQDSTTEEVLETLSDPCAHWPQGGWPISQLCQESTSSSQGHCTSDTDTDIEAQIDSPILDLKLPIPARIAKEHVCPVCSCVIFSGLQLIAHMKLAHRGMKPYCCEQCGSSFNNLHTKSSHVSLVHQAKLVKCKHCDYATVTRAQMHQHVWKHTRGFHCKTCSRSFQNKKQWSEYHLFHPKHQCYDCKSCKNYYFSCASLHIHQIGKHSPGYVCHQCRACFDISNQWKRHQVHCIQWTFISFSIYTALSLTLFVLCGYNYTIQYVLLSHFFWIGYLPWHE